MVSGVLTPLPSWRWPGREESDKEPVTILAQVQELGQVRTIMA